MQTDRAKNTLAATLRRSSIERDPLHSPTGRGRIAIPDEPIGGVLVARAVFAADRAAHGIRRLARRLVGRVGRTHRDVGGTIAERRVGVVARHARPVRRADARTRSGVGDSADEALAILAFGRAGHVALDAL